MGPPMACESSFNPSELMSAERLQAERMALAADPMMRLQMAAANAHAHTHTHAHSHTHLHLHQQQENLPPLHPFATPHLMPHFLPGKTAEMDFLQAS